MDHFSNGKKGRYVTVDECNDSTIVRTHNRAVDAKRLVMNQAQ